MARQKPATHQLSESSKKAGKDFGEASKQAAYIRNAFAPLLKIYAYGDITTRFTQRLCQIFKTIPDQYKGSKKLINGDVKLLSGFEFNSFTPIGNLLYQLPYVKVDPVGLINLHLQKMEMNSLVKMVQNAEVFVLRLMVFALSLTDDQVEIISIEDYPVSLNRADFDGATLDIPFDSAGEKVLMLAMGISYLKGNIAFGNRKYFAGGITHCWHLKDGIEVYFKPELLVVEAKIVEEMGKLKWKSY